jgi:hypothetical protein
MSFKILKPYLRKSGRKYRLKSPKPIAYRAERASWDFKQARKGQALIGSSAKRKE